MFDTVIGDGERSRQCVVHGFLWQVEDIDVEQPPAHDERGVTIRSGPPYR